MGAYLTNPFKMQELLGYVRAQLADRVVEPRGSDEDVTHTWLDWSLTGLGKVVDDTGAIDGSLLTAAGSAEALCWQFHQSQEVVRAARWATLIWGSRALPGMVLPSALSSPQSELPELREILSALAASPQGEELPTAVQAVAMALSRMSAPSLLGFGRPRAAPASSVRHCAPDGAP